MLWVAYSLNYVLLKNYHEGGNDIYEELYKNQKVVISKATSTGEKTEG